MIRSRRIVLAALAASGFCGRLDLLEALQSPQPIPSPNAPNPNVPTGLNGSEIPKATNATPNPLNQEQIAAAVQQLYKLAGELKDEVEHTDLRSTFSLSFLKKTQQIEKLAKQIKERVKG